MTRTHIGGPVLLLLFASASVLWAGKEYPQQPGEQVVPNQLIIKMKSGVLPGSIVPLYLQNALIQALNLPDTYLIRLPAAIAPGVSAFLAAHPLVDYVEPDRVRRIVIANPTDPYYINSLSDQWGLFTVQALQAWNLLGAPYLTSATAGTNRVSVAVIDSGADCTHPDFKNTGGSSTDSASGGQLLWSASQAIVNTTIASPACPWLDDYGHGTHVTGIIAAATSNGVGVASLGYPLQVMEFKSMDNTGSGSDTQIANGIAAAVAAGAKVISMSLGGAGYSQTLQAAINNAWQHNVVVVSAAGNSSTNALFYPGGANHGIGVSASDINNNLAGFSNYGNDVTVGAPGVGILSTIPTYTVPLVGCCNYGSLSGTSMATPFASALTGLLAMTTPNTSAAAIVQRLQQSAAVSTGVDWGQNFGYGIINAYNAIAGIKRTTTTGGMVGQILGNFGFPVGSAQISISNATNNQTTTANSAGLYWIRPLAAGTYNVTIGATGYATQSLTATVTPGADTPLTVTMGVAYGSFSGTVTDQGAPVTGAIVEALSGGLVIGNAVTDPSGFYTLWVPGGSGYTVAASQIQMTTTSVAGQSVTAGGNTTVNLTLPSMLGTIAGVVTDLSSNAIVGATISVTSSIYSTMAVTNGSGSYSIANLPLGTYSVTASATGFPSATSNGVGSAADTTTTANFQLGTAGQSQTITFGGLSNNAFGAAPFTVSATASSGLSVSFASTTSTICTISGTTVTLVAVGTCTIQATQAGNATYATATPVNQSFQVTQGSQTITFGALSNQAFGTSPFAVSGTASSGLAVSFASTTSTICTMSGSTVTLVAVGTCTVQATQSGSTNWAVATPVNQSFQVTQGSQTISFGALSNKAFGTAAFAVSATASSGLAVSFASTTSTICTVSAATVTLVALGTCTIQATQAGNTNWSAAAPVNQSFQVTQGSQTITFGALSNHAFGTGPVLVNGTASSGLTVNFASTTSTICTVSGATVTLVAVGTCTIQATQVGNANWAAATPVNQSFQVTQGSQTITFGAPSNQPFGTAPFAMSATASSGLTVSFASTTSTICTVSSATVTLVAVGTCTIQATQSGNANWAAATAVNQSFQVTQGSQTITFGGLSNKAFGTAPFTVSGTASSGLTVNFASTTSTICTVSGATVTLVAVGTCTIQATQTGNTNWAGAPPVNQSLQVTQASQTITFGALSNMALGTAPFAVSATASSGLAVSFASTTSTICTVSGTTVTLVAAGSCTIQATQAGNTNWTAATPVNQSFQVTQGTQTTTFGALANQAFGTAPFAVSGTASSGLTVSFASTTSTICLVSGATVTLVAVGTCTIQATQSGNTNWSAATPVNQSFQVTQGNQTIAFGALSNEAFGTAPFAVSATASSGLAVSFASTTSTICTVSGATVTLVAVGTCTIQATQAGNTNWSAATPVNQSFQVTQGSQTITFGALSNKSFGTVPFAMSGTASSGLAVGFASTTSTICTVSGATVTLVAVGTCTIQATQGGNANWAAATPVNQSFQVTQGTQTTTFGALANQAFGTAPFAVSGTASSGLTVSFASTTSTICTLSGATVTLAAVGTCTIQATQAGNTNWSAATPVNQSFQVTQGTQTITFPALSNQAFGAVPFTVGATASSGLTVNFASTTSTICTVSGATVTLVAVGTCTIQATQAGNTNWSAATPVSQSFQVMQGNQTITFGTPANQAYGTAPFAVSATSSSSLPVSFASTTSTICTVSGATVTLVAFGTCTIQAMQAGNTNWSAATPVNQSFLVTQGSQTITFGALSNQAFGTASFAVSGTASSGLTVSLASTTSTICTVSGAAVALVAVGTCTIQATQSGNANWAAATPVNQSFQVTQGTQTITFGALSNHAFGTGPFGVSGTASSGLTVSFASITSTFCTVSGTTVTLVGVGTCTIQATQAGNTNWAASTPVNQSFQVTQGSQTITFGALSNQVFGTAPFTVSATSSSSLPVSFASTTSTICTVSGTTVTLIAAGTCTIQATQAGNANWAAATPLNQSFQVTQGSQTITFGALFNMVFETPAFAVSATASSGLSVSFASTTSTICTVSGSTVTLVAVGTCTIQATQAGNTTWAAATPVNQSFQVTPAGQTITFASLSNAVFGATPITVSATASSGLTVSFISTTSTICTVSGSTVTLVALGTCTIQGTQAGNTNWAAATPVNQSFQVTQGSQTISFGILTNQALGVAPFVVSATASSGLTVSFTSTTAAVCTVSTATVTLVSIGTCTIQATQGGNLNYAAAPSVSQSFLVTAGLAIPGANSLNFANTIASKSSATQTVTLQNSGNAALTITSILPTGSDAANYKYTADTAHPCPITPAALGPGASCILDVAFVPVSQGTHSNAQLTITDNSGNVAGTTQTIGLSGTGIVLSSIAVQANSASLVYNTTEQFTATGTYSDTSTADLTNQATWASSAPGVATISSAGLATALLAGQTNLMATLSGVTSNSFQLTVAPGSPATISVSSGSGQSAPVGTAFANPLQALVKDAGGNVVPNASVTFTLPQNGASATFSNGLTTYTAGTNSSGVATSVTLAANFNTGSYSAAAAVTGVASVATFSLTNVKSPVLTVTEAPVGVLVPGQSAVYTITVGNAVGAGPTSGPVTVTDSIPTGFTLTGLNGGPTWNCSLLTASCTTNAVLNGGATYPSITITFTVPSNAQGSVNNGVSAYGGGAAMSTASDPTPIITLCNVTQSGTTGPTDVQLMVNEALGVAPAANDLNHHGVVNVLDVQLVINAAMGMGCSVS